MTTPIETAEAYFAAWTSHDVEEALALLADDFVCDAPAGRMEGKEAYRAFMAPFAQGLISATLWAVYGDDERAVLVYDTETPGVPSGPASELLTVVDGRIVHDRFIFDRVPFAQARAAATALPG